MQLKSNDDASSVRSEEHYARIKRGGATGKLQWELVLIQ